MSISTRVDEFLNHQNISFSIVGHPLSSSSISSAIAAKIPAKNIAKAVMLEDHEGRHLMAVLPADRKISLHKLQEHLAVSLHLVHEKELDVMFQDCQQGAIPALASAYHVNSIYDEALNDLSDVYLEAGDHQTLIHLKQDQFSKLMASTKHMKFSAQIIH